MTHQREQVAAWWNRPAAGEARVRVRILRDHPGPDLAGRDLPFRRGEVAAFAEELATVLVARGDAEVAP